MVQIPFPEEEKSLKKKKSKSKKKKDKKKSKQKKEILPEKPRVSGSERLSDVRRASSTVVGPPLGIGNLQIFGRENEYYKSPQVTQFIDDIYRSQQIFSTMSDFESKFMKQIDKLHYKDSDKSSKKSYVHRQTEKYLHIKCKVDRCHFALWFKFERNPDQELINLVFFRKINQNHDI